MPYICVIISVQEFPAAKRDQQEENTLIGANVMFHPMDKEASLSHASSAINEIKGVSRL